MPSEIAARRAMQETSLRHDRNHVLLLPRADLQDKESAFGKHARNAPRESAIGVQTVMPARERQMRVMLTNLARQASDLPFRDIGRVRDDEIEPTIEPLGPVALAKCRASPDAVLCGIGARGGASFGRKIDAEPPRSPAFAEQRDQQAAAAGAEIENGERIVPARSQCIECSLDNGLAVGTRLQRRGRQAKWKAPEFTLADDAPDRLAGETASAELTQSRQRFTIRRPSVECGLGKPARIDRSGLDASLPQTRRQLAARVDFSKIPPGAGRAFRAQLPCILSCMQFVIFFLMLARPSRDPDNSVWQARRACLWVIAPCSGAASPAVMRRRTLLS